MEHQNENIELRKNKHLNFNEHMTIEFRLKDGFSVYNIAKELKLPINTILNEIRRGITTQISQGNYIEMYLTDTRDIIYKNNGKNSCLTFKRLEYSEFINCEKSKHDYVLLAIIERKTRNIKLSLRLRKHLKSSVMYMMINLVIYSKP